MTTNKYLWCKSFGKSSTHSLTLPKPERSWVYSTAYSKPPFSHAKFPDLTNNLSLFGIFSIYLLPLSFQASKPSLHIFHPKSYMLLSLWVINQRIFFLRCFLTWYRSRNRRGSIVIDMNWTYLYFQYTKIHGDTSRRCKPAEWLYPSVRYLFPMISSKCCINFCWTP